MLTVLRWMMRLSGGLAAIWCAGFVVFAAMSSQPADERVHADGIVALTGGESRIDEAVRLLADHRGQRLLISGVNQHTSRTALELLTPDSGDLFDCCIDLGKWAKDTVGNADETERWAKQQGYKRLIVVTSGYHMARSLTELTRAMPDIELIPHPVFPVVHRATSWWTSPTATRLLFVEYVKLWPALARLYAARVLAGQSVGASTAATSGIAHQRDAAVD